jgi:C_GCAxxG_C_C family probable redox protein
LNKLKNEIEIIEKGTNMTKKEIAVGYFTEKGCNCSQSVFLSFCEDYNIPRELGARIAASFGGGIGRQGETCGALTGALMALGLKSGKNFLDDKNAKSEMIAITKDFINNFKMISGSIKCRDLMGCDVGSEAGQLYIKQNDLSSKVCKNLVAHAAEMLEEIK